MKKMLHVMNDPKLDAIFTEAYHATMNDVANVEREKSLSDHIDAYAGMFERDLATKDLTASERQEFVRAFRQYIRTADSRRTSDERRRKRRMLIRGIIVAGFITAGGLIYIGAASPFTTRAGLIAKLNQALSQVDNGYGGYSREFYKTLRRFERRLGPGVADSYREKMHAELDEHFREYLEQVRNGNIVYTDDAKEWAGYFPDAPEREARREAVENVFQETLGRKVEETVGAAAEETKNFLKRAFDFIKKQIDENS